MREVRVAGAYRLVAHPLPLTAPEAAVLYMTSRQAEAEHLGDPNPDDVHVYPALDRARAGKRRL